MSNDYEIGWGKPPKHSQFKPGQSGNSKGRPKGTRNLKTDLQEELSEKVKVREGRETRVISKQLALVKRVVADALNGKGSAQRTVFELIERSSNLDPDQTHTQDLKPEEQEVLDVLLKRGRQNETSSNTDDGDEE
jgi:hypothetical protein